MVPVAAGVAVVTPAHAILEVLDSEVQRELRDKRDIASLSAAPPN
jgi:hypothetical protein